MRRKFAKSRKNNNDEKGQSTVEFALVLVLLMSFIFFFFQLAMVFSWGSFVQYATFMSARAYLSGSSDTGDQNRRAQEVLIKMLKKGGQPNVDRLPIVAKADGGGDVVKGATFGPGPQYQANVRNFSWMQGVTYTFKSRLFMIPFGAKISPQLNTLKLRSESWLGAETSYNDCVRKVQGIIDNGC